MSKSIEKHRKTFIVAAPGEAWGPLRVLPSVPSFVLLLFSRPLVCAQKKSLRGMQHLQSFGCTDVNKRKKAVSPPSVQPEVQARIGVDCRSCVPVPPQLPQYLAALRLPESFKASNNSVVVDLASNLASRASRFKEKATYRRQNVSVFHNISRPGVCLVVPTTLFRSIAKRRSPESSSRSDPGAF